MSPGRYCRAVEGLAVHDLRVETRCPRCFGVLIEYVHHVASVTGPRRYRTECVRCDYVSDVTEDAATTAP